MCRLVPLVVLDSSRVGEQQLNYDIREADELLGLFMANSLTAVGGVVKDVFEGAHPFLDLCRDQPLPLQLSQPVGETLFGFIQAFSSGEFENAPAGDGRKAGLATHAIQLVEGHVNVFGDVVGLGSLQRRLGVDRHNAEFSGEVLPVIIAPDGHGRPLASVVAQDSGGVDPIEEAVGHPSCLSARPVGRALLLPLNFHQLRLLAVGAAHQTAKALALRFEAFAISSFHLLVHGRGMKDALLGNGLAVGAGTTGKVMEVGHE